MPTTNSLPCGESPVRTKKQTTREKLLSAAAQQFLYKGYLNVSVEDISTAAGVSRMTFYRYFTDKVALSIELFQHEVAKVKPLYWEISKENFYDREAVKRWITTLFEVDKNNTSTLKVFSQVMAVEPRFTQAAQTLIADLITHLGRQIPAFNLNPDHAEDRRRWLEAWLLLYEVLDQSNHAALNSGIANDPWIVDILADRFVAFVQNR